MGALFNISPILASALVVVLPFIAFLYQALRRFDQRRLR
mgnify:CR=1 FL=1